jgi:hypothetical protein
LQSTKDTDMDELDLMDPELVSLRNRANAYSGWAKEPDRAARMARVRAAKQERIAREIDPDGTMPPEELAARIRSRIGAQNSRAAYIRALKQRTKQGAGPSVAAGGPAGETTTTQAASTGQESR